YLPPEVFRGERAEPRQIDVYGLGLLLNEALTGVHPFPIESGLTPAAALATVGMRKLQEPALDPGEGAPEPLRKLIRAATSPDPKTRPDMGLMHRVLASLVERRGGASAVATAAAAPARVPAWSPPPDSTMRGPDPVRPGGATYGGQTTSHSRRRFRERRKSVIVAWAASVIAAALLTALVLMMMHGPRGRDETLSPDSTTSPSSSQGSTARDIKPRAVSAASPSPIPSSRATSTTSTTTTTTTTTIAPPAPVVSVSPRPSPRPSPHPSPAATPPAAEPPPPPEPTPTPV